ncbi:MAG: hypothetical protein ABI746_00350 [Dermatophilaceae bacterium]
MTQPRVPVPGADPDQEAVDAALAALERVEPGELDAQIAAATALEGTLRAVLSGSDDT